MHKQVFIFIWLILLGFISNADTIPSVIFGVDKSYAGQEIQLFGTADFITGTKELLAIDTVAEDGSFRLSFPLDQTKLIAIPLGIYECILYVEPHSRYQVILPPYQPKTKGDLFNPFFAPVQTYLGIKNIDSTDVNLQIAAFNDQYHAYLDSNYYYIFKHPREANIESVIKRIESSFDSIPDLYFYNYRKYKYAWLKYTTIMRDNRYVTREYFNNQPILYQNTSYMDLFNQLYTNYLTFYLNTSEGERLYSDIAQAKSPMFVKETFSNNMALLNDTLQEFVLLKGLHDAFYSKDFPTSSLLITLDSIASDSKIEVHREIAKNIRRKVLKMHTGYDPPAFSLFDTDSVLRTNKEYLSNYVYLNFISVESFACQKDLELLKELYEKHKTDFRVVSISVDDDFDLVKKYFQEHGYEWTLLHDSSDKATAQDYNVRVYPMYYLINPEGKLSMSPAPGPGEGFEWYFFNLLQSKRRGQH